MKTAIDLTKGRPIKVLLLFALPIMISNIFQQLYNTADTMIVGRFLGENSLAAVGASAAIFELVVGFALGMGNGMSIVVARYYGAKDEDMVKKSVASALVIGICLSALVMLLGAFGLYPLLELLGTPSHIIDQSYSYISIIMRFVLVTFSYNMGAGLLRAIGDSLTALYILVAASIFNICLDLLFITQLGLGIAGAGYATILAQTFSSSLCFLYILKRCPHLVPKKAHFKPDKSLYLDLLGQGLSMGLMYSIVSIGTVILQTAINGFGVAIIAAQTTARRIQSFFLMPLTATAAGLATYTSQNLGANQKDRIGRGVKSAVVLVVSWGLIAMLILYLFSGFLTGLIAGQASPELLAASNLYLRWNSPFYPVLGILFVLRNSLQGLGQKLTPLMASVIELLGKISFVFFVIPSWGYMGVILCEPIIWFFMVAQLAYGFKKEWQQVFNK